MSAGDWVGWLILVVLAIACAAVIVSQVAVYWPDIRRWVRIRTYAAKHAPALVAKACACDQVSLTLDRVRAECDQLLLTIARVRAERDELRREVGRLSRENKRLQDRERSAVTVLQLPRI